MNVYTIFTPSHQELYTNYFIKTLPNDLNLKVIQDSNQYCKEGVYYTSGWSKVCLQKIDLFIRACEENLGDVFLYSDVDVQFFGPVKNQLLLELGTGDIACQDDSARIYNSGFFVCRANKATLNMFKTMKDNYSREDQTTLNKHIHMVRHKFLSHRFFTIGQIFHRMWMGDQFNIPDHILTHHANWVIGLNNKKKLLDLVRLKFNQKQLSYS